MIGVGRGDVRLGFKESSGSNHGAVVAGEFGGGEKDKRMRRTRRIGGGMRGSGGRANLRGAEFVGVE